jgi:hypothetical protein
LAAALVVAAATCSGCGGATAGSDDQSRAAMKLLGIEYGRYLAAHGSPPKDEAAWRAYLESRMSDLSAYGVKSVDDLLGKGRDGQPIQVIYGATVTAPHQTEYPWAAYEQTGVGGQRLAVNVRGGLQELAPDEFSKQVPIK